MDAKAEEIAAFLFQREECRDLDARIREDASIDDDDAEELFEALEKQFGYTAWRENLYDFFQDEYSCCLWPQIKRWLYNQKIHLPSLTIRDVAICAAKNIPLQPSHQARIR